MPLSEQSAQSGRPLLEPITFSHPSAPSDVSLRTLAGVGDIVPNRVRCLYCHSPLVCPFEVMADVIPSVFEVETEDLSFALLDPIPDKGALPYHPSTSQTDARSIQSTSRRADPLHYPFSVSRSKREKKNPTKSQAWRRLSVVNMRLFRDSLCPDGINGTGSRC